MSRLALPLAFAAAFAAAGTLHAEANAYVKFQNDTQGELRVDILYSSAKPTAFSSDEVQKGKYVAAGEDLRFKFSSSESNCNNKSRHFVVSKANNGVRGDRLGYGSFKFKGSKVNTTGQFSRKVCILELETLTHTVKAPGFSFGWDDGDIGDNSTAVTVTGKP